MRGSAAAGRRDDGPPKGGLCGGTAFRTADKTRFKTAFKAFKRKYREGFAVQVFPVLLGSDQKEQAFVEREAWLLQAADDEERLLRARFWDLAREAAASGTLESGEFLDIHQQARLRRDFGPLGKALELRLYFWGASPWAERKLPLFLPAYYDLEADEEGTLSDWPDYLEEDPLTYLRILFPPQAETRPGHRDILGAVMALGLARSRMGDLFFHDEGCDIPFLGAAAEPVLRELDRAGRTPVQVRRLGSRRELQARAPVLESRTVSLASMRLDNVLAALWHLNREKAKEYIAQGLVSLDGIFAEKPAQTVEEGQIIRCRGLGKAKVGRIEGHSRKGRLLLELAVFSAP